jgi:hypothetical protein
LYFACFVFCQLEIVEEWQSEQTLLKVPSHFPE